MKFLVGYTGFVGSNLAMQCRFDGLFNSKNIEKAYGKNPDLLVYSGVPAQKFIANSNPKKDFETIQNAIENIKKINPKKVVLISTIDIYKNPINVDEDSHIISEDLEAYGKNRFYLEEWIKENYKDYLIIHLPGLYGKNIKKNFIYDLIKIIPNMLKEEKFNELVKKDNFISSFYIKDENGFYKCKNLSIEETKDLKKYFNKIGFSALNFTDSRGIYQFYNLAYLWEHIQIALNKHLKILNLATEPVSIKELYKYIIGKDFKNEINSNIAHYNFKTKYEKLFGGKNGYIFDKNFVLEDIKNFIYNEQNEIKIAISNIAWNKNMDEDVYRILQNNNITSLEIAPTRIIEEKPYDNIPRAIDKINILKKEFNLSIVSMQSIWFGKTNKIFESQNDFDEMLNYTYKAIDFAYAINCPNLVFGSPKNRNMINYEQDYPKALDFFKKIGLYAKEKGVVIALEPNPTIYHTNFINTTKEAIDFVKKLNLDSIKVNYDLGTVIFNHESLEFLKENLNYINHIHISEPNLETIIERPIHKQLFKILRELHYTKTVSIEMKTIESTKEIAKVIRYVKDL